MANTEKNNYFYKQHYQKMMMCLIVGIFLMLAMVVVVLNQIFHRPLPLFNAVSSEGATLVLTPSAEPSLISSTLIRWASKAAVAAYTFDFVNYNKQVAAVHSYFTEAGWIDYQNSIRGLIKTITQNQLFVNSVVSGPPVISNQGELPSRGYVWRIQMPFLVMYQSAESKSSQLYTVIMTIVRVSTSINPAGIGIDQFVMQ